MRQGYSMYWKALKEYEAKFPPKKDLYVNRQLSTNRLSPGMWEGCRVYLKEKGKGNKITVGFENKHGTFIEQIDPTFAGLFTPESMWTLELVQVGEIYITKQESLWRLIHIDGRCLFESKYYPDVKQYSIDSGLDYRRIIINQAWREDERNNT